MIKQPVVLVLAATALIVVALYIYFRSWMAHFGIVPEPIEAGGWLILCSIAVGIVASLWLTHRLIQWLQTSALSGAQRSIVTSVSAYILAAASLPFALFLGVVLGGNLGGAWGERLIGSAGVVIGIGVGLFAVTLLVTGIAAVVGFFVGILIVKFLKSWRIT